MQLSYIMSCTTECLIADMDAKVPGAMQKAAEALALVLLVQQDIQGIQIFLAYILRSIPLHNSLKCIRLIQ